MIHGVPGTWTRSSALVNPQMNVRPAAGSHAACAATWVEIAMAAASRMDALLKPMTTSGLPPAFGKRNPFPAQAGSGG